MTNDAMTNVVLTDSNRGVYLHPCTGWRARGTGVQTRFISCDTCWACM